MIMFVLRWTVACIVALGLGCDEVSPEEPVRLLDPTFSSIQQNLFNVSCVTSSCHGSSAEGGLRLTSDVSYANLINVISQEDKAHVPSFLRVKVGSPDSSFLMIKLNGPGTNQGDRMPRLGSAVSDQALKAIRDWIAAGAMNN